MYFLLENVEFRCYVSLLEGKGFFSWLTGDSSDPLWLCVFGKPGNFLVKFHEPTSRTKTDFLQVKGSCFSEGKWETPAISATSRWRWNMKDYNLAWLINHDWENWMTQIHHQTCKSSQFSRGLIEKTPVSGHTTGFLHLGKKGAPTFLSADSFFLVFFFKIKFPFCFHFFPTKKLPLKRDRKTRQVAF